MLQPSTKCVLICIKMNMAIVNLHFEYYMWLWVGKHKKKVELLESRGGHEDDLEGQRAGPFLL